jgi:hypothetical protein
MSCKFSKFLPQDVVSLANEFRASEERYHKLNSQKLISLAFQKRAQDEFKTYTSKNANEKSFRYFQNFSKLLCRQRTNRYFESS